MLKKVIISEIFHYLKFQTNIQMSFHHYILIREFRSKTSDYSYQTDAYSSALQMLKLSTRNRRNDSKQKIIECSYLLNFNKYSIIISVRHSKEHFAVIGCHWQLGQKLEPFLYCKSISKIFFFIGNSKIIAKNNNK